MAPHVNCNCTRRLTPCGRTRREFLWQAGGGFAGTALAWLLAADGFLPRARAQEPAASGGTGVSPVTSPLAPRPPHFEPKASACIFLFMYGGPSHVDLWDPKPELERHAGERIPYLDEDELLAMRNVGTLMPSTHRFTPAGESGIEVSDLWPHLRNSIDKIALIRSMYTESFAHGSGLLQMNTGFLRQGYPSVGSWLTYGLGTMNQDLPGYVVMLDQRGGPISGPPNWGSGFMPAAYQGTQFRPTGEPILDLVPPEGISDSQRRRQLDLLAELNAQHLERHPDDTELAARIASYELAFRMQAEAPEAVDIDQETEETHRLYGLDNETTAPFGRRCLLARRLVERGVRFVQVYSGGGHNDENWDAHTDVNFNHELHCAETDQPIHALLTDLEQRGLLDSTLVVWTGEFGRTPTAENSKGRDHNPRGFSAWMAGGGIRGGQVVGATDPLGYRAVEDPVHIHDLHATILHQMGLDHTLLTYFHGGRDMRLTDVAGNVIEQIV